VISRISVCTAALLLTCLCLAQNPRGDVLDPIGKYIAKGDAESLSAWFDDELDISILAGGGVSSRLQARQIMKSFFKKFPPESFRVDYTAERANLKYVLATLNAGGESFHLILFLNSKSGTYLIQQLKIDRIVQ